MEIREHANIVYWYWFTVHILMLVADAVWWKVAMRLTKRRLWRALVSVFIGGQMAAHLSLMCGLDWRSHVPQGVAVMFVIWHYFALGLGLAILLPLVMLRACARSVRALAWRAAGKVRDEPVVAPAGPNLQTRREFMGACAALAAPVFSVGLTGMALAQLNQLSVRRFTLAMPALPRDLDGITIAHLSDTHVGGLTSGQMLREMVSTTNALRADLVVMTGDLIDYALTDLSEGISLAKAMEGRYGLWMIEGNHDLMENGVEFERRVKAAGVPLLLDESAVIHVRGHPVQLLGLSWKEGVAGSYRERDRAISLQVGALMKQRQPDAFPILLAHHPHTFDAAVKAGLPLTLSGHTHGGFWMLNDRLGVGSIAFRYWSGLYQRNGGQLIVSNGIGNWKGVPPIRINAPAEIVHITLRCAESPA
jgi:uncharacterized protein